MQMYLQIVYPVNNISYRYPSWECFKPLHTHQLEGGVGDEVQSLGIERETLEHEYEKSGALEDKDKASRSWSATL